MKMFRGFRRIGRHQGGNVAMLFGLMLIPLIGMMGLAVDSARAYSVKLRLQESIDSAALVGAKNFSSPHRNQMITDYFDENWKAGFMGSATPTLNITPNTLQRTITITAQVQMPTVFMWLFNRPSVTIGTLTSSVSGQAYLELAIALDNTVSMRQLINGQRRIDVMKQAATNFVNIMYTVSGSVQNSVPDMWVSIIPFTSLVNVGSQHTNFLVPGSTTGLVWDYPKNTTTQNSWRGCLFERSFYNEGTYSGNDMTDASPSTEAFYPYHVPYPQIWAYTSCSDAPTCWASSYCVGGVQSGCPDPSIPICSVGGACSTTPGACSSGSAINDNGLSACDTTRTWQCTGAFGGGTANCSKFNGACNVNGACGSAGSCNSGTAINNNGASGCGTTTTWQCTGTGTGTTVDCSYTAASCTVNGSCGGTSGTCSSGSPINDNGLTVCDTVRTWQCQGVLGGTTASCAKANTACLVNGSCGGSGGSCMAGSTANDNNSTACGTTRTWQCVGSSGGTTASCSFTNGACSICIDVDGQQRSCKSPGALKPFTLPPVEGVIKASVPAGCHWGNPGLASNGDVIYRPAYSYQSSSGITVNYFGLAGNLNSTFGYNATIPGLVNGAAAPSKNASGVSACCGYGVYGTNSDVLGDNMYAYAWEPWRAFTMNGRILLPWPWPGTPKLGGWGNSGCGLPMLPLTESRTALLSTINQMDIPPAAASGSPEPGYGGTLINEGLVWAWRSLSSNWKGFWRNPNGSAIDPTLPIDYGTSGSTKAVVVMTDGLNFLPDRRARMGGNGAFFFAQRPAQTFTVNDPNLAGGSKDAMSANNNFADVDSSAYGLLRHNFDVTDTGLYGTRNPLSFCRQRQQVGNVANREPHLAAWGCREYDCMLRDSSGNCLRSNSPVTDWQGTPSGTFSFLDAITGPYYDELTRRLLVTCANMRAHDIRIFFILFAIDDNPMKTAALSAFQSCVGSDGAVFDASDSTQLNNAFSAIAMQLRELRLRQ